MEAPTIPWAFRKPIHNDELYRSRNGSNAYHKTENKRGKKSMPFAPSNLEI